MSMAVATTDSVLIPSQVDKATLARIPDTIPAEIPNSLAQWKEISKEQQTYDRAWMAFNSFFLAQGYELFAVYFREVKLLAPRCMVEQTGPDKFGMLGNFVFIPPLRLVNAHYTWPATELVTGRPVIIRVMKHNIDQQDSSTGAAGLFSVYRYLLSVCNEEDSRNHTMLPLKFLEHEGWTFGVFARWGEIQTGFGGMDMHQVGDAMDFLAQVSEGLAYLNSLGIAHTLIHEDSFVRNILGAEQFHPNWSAYRAFEPEPLPIKYGIVLHSLARFVDPNVVPDSHEDISDLNESGNVTSAMSKLSSPHVTTGTTRDTYKHENKLKAFVRQAFKGKTKGHTSVNPYLARDVYQFGELIRASLLPLLSHVPELDPLTQHMTSRRREDRPTMVEVHQHLADIQNLLDEEVKQRECPMEFVGKWPPVNEELAELYEHCRLK